MNKMEKSEVYNWRLSKELRRKLEAAARNEKTSVDAILDRLARAWLAKRAPASEEDDAEQQLRLKERAMKAIGTVSVGGPSATNAEVRRVMGEFLEAKHRAAQRRAPRRAR
jgi:hypothetical protein